MKGAASGVVGDLARARIALDERGQKLGELEERTAAMMASADSFSKHAHEVTETVIQISKTYGAVQLNPACDECAASLNYFRNVTHLLYLTTRGQYVLVENVLYCE